MIPHAIESRRVSSDRDVERFLSLRGKKKTTRLSSSETLMKTRTWTILCLRLTWYRSKISIRGSGSHANQFQVKTPDRTTPYIYQLIVIITQVCLHVSIEESVRDKSTRNTRSPLESDSTLSEMTLIVNYSRYSSWKTTCQWIKETTISTNMTTERGWLNWKFHRVSKLRQKYSYPMIHKTWNKTRGTFGNYNLITTVDMKRRKTRTLKNCSNYPVSVILSCFDV